LDLSYFAKPPIRPTFCTDTGSKTSDLNTFSTTGVTPFQRRWSWPDSALIQ